MLTDFVPDVRQYMKVEQMTKTWKSHSKGTWTSWQQWRDADEFFVEHFTATLIEEGMPEESQEYFAQLIRAILKEDETMWYVPEEGVMGGGEEEEEEGEGEENDEEDDIEVPEGSLAMLNRLADAVLGPEDDDKEEEAEDKEDENEYKDERSDDNDNIQIPEGSQALLNRLADAVLGPEGEYEDEASDDDDDDDNDDNIELPGGIRALLNRLSDADDEMPISGLPTISEEDLYESPNHTHVLRNQSAETVHSPDDSSTSEDEPHGRYLRPRRHRSNGFAPNPPHPSQIPRPRLAQTVWEQMRLQQMARQSFYHHPNAVLHQTIQHQYTFMPPSHPELPDPMTFEQEVRWRRQRDIARDIEDIRATDDVRRREEEWERLNSGLPPTEGYIWR